MGTESESRSRQHSCIQPSVPPASVEPNHFFKIILPESLHGKKLRIPREFIKRFGSELRSVATVAVPDGLVWKMGLKKSANEVWLCNGWQEFVKYYSISYGSFLVFKYEGNSNFCVVIFDMTAAEIYYPCNNQSNNGEPNFENQRLECPRKRSCLDHCGYDTRNTRRKLENQEIIDLDKVNKPSRGKSRKNASYDLHEHSRKNGKDRFRLGQTEGISHSFKLETVEEIIDVDNVNSPSHDKSRKNASYNLHEHSRKDGKDTYGQGHNKRMTRSSSKLESLTLKKKQRALEAAQKFKPKNPSFTAILKSSSVNSYLHVPASFAAKYLRRMGSVKFLESNGQQWEVHCTYYKDKCSTMLMGRGWINFAKDNHLREGDVCV